MTKKSNDIKSYEAFTLNALRARVISRYKDNQRKRGLKVDEVLIFSTDHHHGIYESFKADIKVSIKRQFNNHTLLSFLLRELDGNGKEIPLQESKRFRPKTIADFSRYADTVQAFQRPVSSPIKQTKLQGSLLIDIDFIQKYKGDSWKFKYEDFYLKKATVDCQWYGVVRHWDCDRSTDELIKDKAAKSFETADKIAVLVHSVGGNGKSTTLRRLAISCAFESFFVLWIEDLDYFLEDLALIREMPGNYLLILEDWYQYDNDPALRDKFIRRILKTGNIRIVIGDRNPIENETYYPHVVEDGAVELGYGENERIIGWVTGINKAWANIAAEVLRSPEFYYAPIYMILFVIGRISEGAEKVTTKSTVSLFKEIMRNDLDTIANSYPGLAKALYYFAQFHKEDGIYITWYSLLKLADSFDNNILASRRLIDFDVNDPVIALISHYISIKGLRYRYFYGTFFFNFHHPVLVDDGLKKLHVTGWPAYQKNMRYEFAEVLWDADEKNSAVDLIIQLLKEEDTNTKDKPKPNYETNFRNAKIIEGCRSKRLGYISLKEAIIFDSMITSYLVNARSNRNEKYWISSMYYLFTFTDVGGDKLRLDVLSDLLKLGCKSESVSKIYNYLLKNDHKSINELFDSSQLARLAFMLKGNSVKLWQY